MKAFPPSPNDHHHHSPFLIGTDVCCGCYQVLSSVTIAPNASHIMCVGNRYLDQMPKCRLNMLKESPETIHLNKWLNGNWSWRKIARIVNAVSYNRGTEKLKIDFAFLTVFAAHRWHCVNFSHYMLKNIFHDKSPSVSKPLGKHFINGQLPYFKKRTI